MGLSFDSYVDDLLGLMDTKARSVVNEKQATQLVQVESTDGFVVDVVFIGADNKVIEGRAILSGITILQSKYFSPCVQKGDIGILLNVSCYLGNVLYETITFENISNKDYYLYIPIIKNADFRSKSSEFMIQSLDEKSKIVIDNENINETTINKSLVCEKNISEAAKENITITSDKALSLKGKNSVTIASDSEMTIKSTKPLAISGGGQSLATALDTFCTALGALSSAGYEAGAIASIVAASNTLKSQLKGILK